MSRPSELFLAVSLSLLPGAAFNVRGVAAEPAIEGWARTYGGTSFDEAHSMVQTADGGYDLAGFTGFCVAPALLHKQTQQYRIFALYLEGGSGEKRE